MTNKSDAQVEAPKTEEVKNPLEHTLTFIVADADIKAGMKAELNKLAKKAKMPGFRPGHVPMSQVEAMYGESAYRETINTLVGKGWVEAAQASGLAIAGDPVLAPVEAPEGSTDLHFKATFEVFPEIELPDFSSLKLKRYTCRILKADIEKTLEIMRKQRATYEEVSRKAKKSDRLTINFKGTKEGVAFEGGTAEGYAFELGEGRMLPEFEEALTGMKAGEKKTFPMTFPEDYGVPTLNGAQVEFEVEMIKVEQANLPELNDEFAISLGIKDGLEKMREEIKENLEREVQARVEERTKAEVMDELAKILTFTVPKSIVSEEEARLGEIALRDMAARGMDVKKMPKMPAGLFTEQAMRRVRLGLMVNKLVADEKITATDDQVREMAGKMGASYEKPEEVIEYMMNDENRRENLRAQVTEANVTEFILKAAKAEKEAVKFAELMGQAE